VWSFSSTHRDASGGNPSESTGAGWPAAPSPSSGQAVLGLRLRRRGRPAPPSRPAAAPPSRPP